MRLIGLILLVMVYLSACDKPNENTPLDTSSIRFVAYVDLFQPIDLPIIWDRDSVFTFTPAQSYIKHNGNQSHEFQDLPDSMLVFVPSFIGADSIKWEYHALYRIDLNRDIVSLVISRYHETVPFYGTLELYLINYSKAGDLKSHMKIAGYGIDYWSMYMNIDDSGEISITMNEILDNPNGDNIHLTYMRQIVRQCNLFINGEMSCEERLNRMGFFDFEVINDRVVGFKFVTE